MACCEYGDRLPLLTGLPRRDVFGNQASGISHCRGLDSPPLQGFEARGSFLHRVESYPQQVKDEEDRPSQHPEDGHDN